MSFYNSPIRVRIGDPDWLAELADCCGFGDPATVSDDTMTMTLRFPVSRSEPCTTTVRRALREAGFRVPRKRRV